MRVINVVELLAHSEASGRLDEDGTVSVTETRSCVSQKAAVKAEGSRRLGSRSQSGDE